jgi:hypothetical protein
LLSIFFDRCCPAGSLLKTLIGLSLRLWRVVRGTHLALLEIGDRKERRIPMKRVLPVLLIAFLLGGCYTEFLTTESEDMTDSTPAWDPPPPPPPPPPGPTIIVVSGATESPASAPKEARRDFGSTRGTAPDNTGSANVGGRTGTRGR